MNLHLNRAVLMVVGALAVAAIMGATIAMAAAPAKSKTAHHKRHHRARAASITEVPASEASAFAALRQPAALKAPQYLQTLAITEPFQRMYAPNAALARAVVPAGGDADHLWYVIPGGGGVCLFDGEGAVCNTLAEALSGRLLMMKIKPVGKSPLPPAGTPTDMTVVGLAPDGVTSVSAATTTGETVSGEVANNTFRIAGTNLAALHLGRADADDLVVRLRS